MDCFRLLKGLGRLFSSSSPSQTGFWVDRAWRRRFAPFFVMSLSWRAALVWLLLLDERVARGVKNFLNLFGVTVGGLFGLWLITESAFSPSCEI